MSERVLKKSVVCQGGKKARISDKALSKAIGQVALGQAEDFGGGVFKKCLNMHRSIVLAKAGEFWVFACLFAKKDRANLAFRKLADLYRLKRKADLEAEIETGALLEIHHGD